MVQGPVYTMDTDVDSMIFEARVRANIYFAP
jgi:hypothetical protein